MLLQYRIFILLVERLPRGRAPSNASIFYKNNKLELLVLFLQLHLCFPYLQTLSKRHQIKVLFGNTFSSKANLVPSIANPIL